MKEYELTILSPQTHTAEAVFNLVDALINQVGGKVTKKEDDGVKRLAYMINGQEYALYTFYDLELTKESAVELSTKLDKTDEVLRYLLVTRDTRKVAR